MDPRTGQILTAPGAANTAAAIGTPIPGTGNLLNGIRQAGDGIAKYRLHLADARRRAALRCGLRPDRQPDASSSAAAAASSTTVPTATRCSRSRATRRSPPRSDLRNGQLAERSGTGPEHAAASRGWRPSSTTRRCRRRGSGRRACRWRCPGRRRSTSPTSATTATTGSARFQGGNTVNLNAVDFGAAYLPQNQDPTQTQHGAWREHRSTTCCGRIAASATSTRTRRSSDDTYHSIQTTLNRRFRNGFAFGVNYTSASRSPATPACSSGSQHAPDGTISVRADQAQYEKLIKNLNRRPHIVKANGVWDLPNVAGEPRADVGRRVLNDWQLSGVLSAGSGPAYDLSYSYNAQRVEQEPDGLARLRRAHRLRWAIPGSGCSDNQYAQFNTAAVTGPDLRQRGPRVGTQHPARLRRTRRSTSRSRATSAWAARVSCSSGWTCSTRSTRSSSTAGRRTIQFNSPTDLTIRNSQFLADGSVDPARLTPNNAGFGAATGAQTCATCRSRSGSSSNGVPTFDEGAGRDRPCPLFFCGSASIRNERKPRSFAVAPRIGTHTFGSGLQVSAPEIRGGYRVTGRGAFWCRSFLGRRQSTRGRNSDWSIAIAIFHRDVHQRIEQRVGRADAAAGRGRSAWSAWRCSSAPPARRADRADDRSRPSCPSCLPAASTMLGELEHGELLGELVEDAALAGLGRDCGRRSRCSGRCRGCRGSRGSARPCRRPSADGRSRPARRSG